MGAARFYRAPDPKQISLEFDPSVDLGPVRVIAAPGGVQPCDVAFVGNLEFGDYVHVFADVEGAFETGIDGVPGTHITIGRQPFWGTSWGIHSGVSSATLLLRLPVQDGSEGLRISSAYRFVQVNAPWVISGSLGSDALTAGQEVPISGRVFLPFAVDEPPPAASLRFSALLIGDAEGHQVGRAQDFVMPFLTPTNLPIEVPVTSLSNFDSRVLGRVAMAWNREGDRWVAAFTTTINIPTTYRVGLYRLTARLGFDEYWPLELDLERIGTLDEASLVNFTIGQPAPMRLATSMFTDVLSEGTRGGILAREDVSAFDISPRVLTRHDPVVPRLDSYGQPWTYRLEPYLPMFFAVGTAPPAVPPIPLDLSDSELKVNIARPDGQTDVLGAAPLTRYVFLQPRLPACFGGGTTTGANPSSMPQLQGEGDTFAYQFPIDGDYVVTLDGHVADVAGRVYEISGTYDVTVANVLDIEAAMLLGTPFEVGDAIAPTITVMPGVPAEVTYEVTHVTAEDETTAQAFSGHANDNGWWDGNGEVFTFDRDGEYRIDVEARYWDKGGNLWAGRMRFGSAVATPDAPIIVHGRRGSHSFEEMPPPWFFRRKFVPSGDGHLWPPFFMGDIQWGVTEERGDDAIEMRNSVQIVDNDHPLIQRAWQFESFQQAGGVSSTYLGSGSIEEYVKAGQLQLVTNPDPELGLPGTHPDDYTLWAYMYGSTQRPGVRVREIVQAADMAGPYWFFRDPYNLQSGNGPEGDEPGDFKFQYAAAVIRDDNSGEGVYAIYGSGWVLTPEDDTLGARVMPPFQGAASGPSGGPLFTVHDREVDMFFLPLGVRPGAVLEMGDTFRMAGPIMPTLPSRIEYTVTGPDDATRTFDGRANAIGYFYDPKDDFVLDQPGLWRVELTVTHDGLTSAGPVEPPYPTGGPLTPGGRTFTFVVIDRDTDRLRVETDLSQTTPDQWYCRGEPVMEAYFEAALPRGWAGDSARVVVTMPGTVLIDEDVTVQNGNIRWDLDAQALNQLASNFDYKSIADTITVTFYAEGTVTGEPARVVGTTVTHGA